MDKQLTVRTSGAETEVSSGGRGVQCRRSGTFYRFRFRNAFIGCQMVRAINISNGKQRNVISWHSPRFVTLSLLSSLFALPPQCLWGVSAARTTGIDIDNETTKKFYLNEQEKLATFWAPFHFIRSVPLEYVFENIQNAAKPHFYLFSWWQRSLWTIVERYQCLNKSF